MWTPSEPRPSVGVADFDNDGWPNIYVANDSTAATLYQNQKDGTFKDMAIEAASRYSPDGKPQAGMGVSIGDFNRDGCSTSSKPTSPATPTLSMSISATATFEDGPTSAGLGVNTRFLGWGVGFFDLDNDGWLDILISNGHVYPEVERLDVEAPYAEHKYLYRNLRNGQFEEVTDTRRPRHQRTRAARGCAFGDYDNDGDIDVVVNCVNSLPQLLRCDRHRPQLDQDSSRRNQINRTGIGARDSGHNAENRPAKSPSSRSTRCAAAAATTRKTTSASTSASISAAKPDSVEIAWPSGRKDKLQDLPQTTSTSFKKVGRS